MIFTGGTKKPCTKKWTKCSHVGSGFLTTSLGIKGEACRESRSHSCASIFFALFRMDLNYGTLLSPKICGIKCASSNLRFRDETRDLTSRLAQKWCKVLGCYWPPFSNPDPLVMIFDHFEDMKNYNIWSLWKCCVWIQWATASSLPTVIRLRSVTHMKVEEAQKLPWDLGR